jgi:hypothetical protein
LLDRAMRDAFRKMHHFLKVTKRAALSSPDNRFAKLSVRRWGGIR